jgi:hypothetical protein
MTGRYSDIYNKRKGTCRIKVGAYTVFIPLLLNSNATVIIYDAHEVQTNRVSRYKMHACMHRRSSWSLLLTVLLVYQEKVPTETIAACEFSPFIFSTTLTEDS